METKTKTTAVNYAVLAICSITVLYPFLWLIANSLKDTRDMIVHSWNLIPEQIHWANYPEAWHTGRIGQHFINSMIVTSVSLAIIVVVCYLASYALARMRFAGRKAISVIFISTMMLPMQVIMIPLYKLEAFFHISNHYSGLIFPYVTSSLPFAIYVMTAFLRTIPDSIEEAGFIDGCSRIQLIWKILFPLSTPGLASIIIFSFMHIWNEFYLALVLIQNPNLKTLTLGLLDFTQEWGTDYTRLFAALVIISAPVIAVYVIFQKQFIDGLTAGAVKH